jgi:ubiquitin-protein ligase
VIFEVLILFVIRIFGDASIEQAVHRLGAVFATLAEMDLKAEHKSPFAPGDVEPWDLHVGHPIDVVALADLQYRKSMCVVRLEGESYLFLGKTDHSELAYDPLTGGVKDLLSIPVGLPSNLGSYSQLNVLLVDDSGTMRLCGDHDWERKIRVAEKWITCFLSAVEFYNIPSVYGICSTNGQIPFALPSRLPRIENLQGTGSRGLWDSFNKLVREIEVSVMSKEWKLTTRIFIITDGIDASTTTPPPYQKLWDLHIFVDAFVLYSAGLPGDITKQLMALCCATGGYAFAPESPELGLPVLKKEAFIDIRFRNPQVPGGDLDIWDGMPWDKELKPFLPYKFSDPLRTLESLPRDIQYRSQRIVEEMAICSQKSFRSFCCKTSIDEWRTFFEAQLPDWRAPFFWGLLMAFPPGYPHSSPVIRFLSIPPAQHVGDLGLVRLPNRFRYHPRMRVVTMLDMIRDLLVKPETGAFLDDDFDMRELAVTEGDVEKSLKTRHFEKPMPLRNLSLLNGCGIRNAQKVTLMPVKSVKTNRKFSDLTWQKIEREVEVAKYGIVVGSDEVTMLPEEQQYQ